MFNALSPTYKGILFALIGYTAFAMTDATAKYLTQSYSVFQIVAIEGVVGIVALLLLSPFIGGIGNTFERKNLKIHGFRFFINFLICVSFTYALAHIPLTTVYALVFTKPFMVSLLAIWMYKQKLEKHQTISILIGFAGTLIVLQPGSTSFDWILLVPIGITVLISLMFLVSNSLKDASVFSLGFYPMAGLMILTTPFAIDGFVMPGGLDAFFFVLIGLTSTTGMVFVSMAFRTANAAVVSPYTYSEIIWGVLFSIFIFNEFPDFWIILGAGVIIFSGMYLLTHERKKSQNATKALKNAQEQLT